MRSVSFRKSSYSNAQGECVEVALYLPGLVAVRDSKGAQDRWLFVTVDGWRKFVGRVQGQHGMTSKPIDGAFVLLTQALGRPRAIRR